MVSSQALLCFHAFLLANIASFAPTISEHLQYTPQDLSSESRLSSLFDRWNLKHGRHYPEGGSSEKNMRFYIFKENLKYIHAHNTRGTSNFTLGLTRFADLTNDEFKSLNYFGATRPGDSARPGHLNLQRGSSNLSFGDTCDTSGLSSTFDWRDEGVVVDVKDQGSCGSCWAFSAVGAMESANAIDTGNLVSLSEQELVSCDFDNSGCNGGWMDYAFSWVIRNGGIDSEDDYPYTSISGIAPKCDSNKLNNNVVSIEGYVDVEQYDESALLCAVAGQPVTIALNGDAFDFQLYVGGVYDGSCASSASSINHAMLVVGWGVSADGVQYWIAKNSWGTYWGSNGYIYLVRGTGSRRGICGMYYQSSYPISSQVTPSLQPRPSSVCDTNSTLACSSSTGSNPVQ